MFIDQLYISLRILAEILIFDIDMILRRHFFQFPECFLINSFKQINRHVLDHFIWCRIIQAEQPHLLGKHIDGGHDNRVRISVNIDEFCARIAALQGTDPAGILRAFQ